MYKIKIRSNSHSPAGHEIKLNKKIEVLSNQTALQAVSNFFKNNASAQRFIGCPVAVITSESYNVYLLENDEPGVYTLTEAV